MSDPESSLLQAVVGLIRNLALCHENQAPLRDADAISKLVTLLTKSHQDAQKLGSSAQQTYQARCVHIIRRGCDSISKLTNNSFIVLGWSENGGDCGGLHRCSAYPGQRSTKPTHYCEHGHHSTVCSGKTFLQILKLRAKQWLTTGLPQEPS